MQNRLIFTNKYGRHSAIFNPMDLIFAGQMYLGEVYRHTKYDDNSSKDHRYFALELDLRPQTMSGGTKMAAKGVFDHL